jgi:D-glycero-D-manno-heptose 1,7-bisphosphate phosphatase
VFLDRDGVINVDTGYPHRPEELILTATAARGIALINASGALAIVVTNQSGVARGMFTLEQVDHFHQAIGRQLALESAHIDAIYVAPYHPDGSVPGLAIEHEDRKPGAGMLIRALAEWPIDSARSVMIGDKQSDAEAAARAGIRSITVPTNNCDLAATVESWLRGVEASE